MKRILLAVLISIILFVESYQAMYILGNWPAFQLWMRGAPLIHPIYPAIMYIIPAIWLLVLAGLIFKRTRIWGLWFVIGIEAVWTAYIFCFRAFSAIIFFPFHALWHKPTWSGIVLQSLSMAWLAFICLIIKSTNHIGASKNILRQPGLTGRESRNPFINSRH